MWYENRNALRARDSEGICGVVAAYAILFITVGLMSSQGSHNSKLVLLPVKSGPPNCIKSRTLVLRFVLDL
jgi:hypothetical protein